MTEKIPTIRRKKFIKIQNLIKLKASPFHGTIQLQINCKAILLVSFSFTNSLFVRGNLKASLISFHLLCVLKTSQTWVWKHTFFLLEDLVKFGQGRRRWFHHEWSRNWMGTTDSLNKYKHPHPSAVFTNTMAQASAYCSISNSLNVSSACPWNKEYKTSLGDQDMLSIIEA